MNFERYTATLSTTISMCKNTLILIEDIKNGKIALSDAGTVKEKILQIMVDYIVLKAHCLFDRTSNALSFEKIASEFRVELGDKKTKSFEKAYKDIKKKYSLLLARFENNRHKGIAHMPTKDELGWNAEALSQLKAVWGKTLKDVNPVTDKYVFLVASNFPIKETHDMLKELEKLIFYELWYPVT